MPAFLVANIKGILCYCG